MSEMLAKRSAKADRVGFERTLEDIHGAWIAYAVFLSLHLLHTYELTQAKQL
jgi:hypothetical protein